LFWFEYSIAPGWKALILVGRDEALCGVGLGDRADAARLKPLFLHALEVVAAILAKRAHHQGLAAQLLEVVRDIGRAAAVFGAQRRHQERHVHAVQLVGQQRVAEAAVVLHDFVERERAADQGGFGHGVAFMDRTLRCGSRTALRPPA
jgi:hypothetical protein